MLEILDCMYIIIINQNLLNKIIKEKENKLFSYFLFNKLIYWKKFRKHGKCEYLF